MNKNSKFVISASSNIFIKYYFFLDKSTFNEKYYSFSNVTRNNEWTKNWKYQSQSVAYIGINFGWGQKKIKIFINYTLLQKYKIKNYTNKKTEINE